MSQNEESAAAPARPVRSFGKFERRAAAPPPTPAVRSEFLAAGETLPLVLRPSAARAGLAAWARENRALVESHLAAHGAILFRDFEVGGVAGFEQFIAATSARPLEYRERSSPRSRVSGNIYTSTDYPAAESIFLHNENSYQHSWPLKIFFYCATAPAAGGETPIADVRRVSARISPATRARFESKGWMYVRNFGDGLGLPWRVVFQTDDRAAVEEHCRRNRIGVEWKEGDRLRTQAVRPALARHPRTGEQVWFNHATFFHVTTLGPEIAEMLLAEFGEQDLPNNTFYGDGSPIEPEVLEELREAYRRETVAFPWRQGDVLMLDNMLVAHGRAPFAGAREVLVGMADPVSRDSA